MLLFNDRGSLLLYRGGNLLLYRGGNLLLYRGGIDGSSCQSSIPKKLFTTLLYTHSMSQYTALFYLTTAICFFGRCAFFLNNWLVLWWLKLLKIYLIWKLYMHLLGLLLGSREIKLNRLELNLMIIGRTINDIYILGKGLFQRWRSEGLKAS